MWFQRKNYYKREGTKLEWHHFAFHQVLKLWYPVSSSEHSTSYYEFLGVSSCQDVVHLYRLLWSSTVLNIIGLFLGIITAAILGAFKDVVSLACHWWTLIHASIFMLSWQNKIWLCSTLDLNPEYEWHVLNLYLYVSPQRPVFLGWLRWPRENMCLN